MKPAPFGYSAPTTVEETVAELGAHDGAKVLAGGQSLLPLLSMRLAAPPHLVDINAVEPLATVRVQDGGVRVGATARHTDVEHDAAAAAAVPLLRDALRLVAHPGIRNRGTVVGSIAHADPSAEMPAVLALLGGSVDLRGAGGTRTVPAADFFVGPLESACEPGELATSAFFPAPPPGARTAIVELSRRHGDYALVGVAVLVETDDPAGADAEATVRRATAAYLSVGPTPVLLDLTDAVGSRGLGRADWAAAGRLAAARTSPDPDIHASADYRRHLVEVLTARALRAAAGGPASPATGTAAA